MSTSKPDFELKDPVHFLALGFGSGLLKPAPGTWGTLVAVPLYCVLAKLSLSVFLVLIFAGFALGIYLCGKTADDVGHHDHGAIVWDEIIGFWITMIAIPFSWVNILVGFALFRFFDIIKPWPIKVVDQKVHGGFGIMIDDVIAGILPVFCCTCSNRFSIFNMQHDQQSGLVTEAEYVESPNHDERPANSEVEAIIIHCISLPPGEYGSQCVDDFFCNRLDTQLHTYFEEISHLTVSSHFVIEREGQLKQFVPTTLRAWHAGESVCLDKPAVNNFSIGIELEGLDTDPDGYTEKQYQTLQKLISCLKAAYPKIGKNSIFAHSDIAPGRKTDPGEFFDWGRLIQA